MEPSRWTQRTGLPDGFLDVSLQSIPDLFPEPTLVHLHGRGPAVFVSILLHGNEDAGLLAVQDLLRRYPDGNLPRALTLFIGNVDACRIQARFLPNQVDFNRSWPGSELETTPIHLMLEEVCERVLDDGVFASIDIHNNTGRNPIYGCICSCAPQHVYLASLFSPRIIYFIRPKGVQTQAFMHHCPSLTCECGRPGDKIAAHAAADLVDRLLHMDTLHPPDHLPNDFEVYHTVARIQIRDGCSIGFEPGCDIVFRRDLDALNFVQLPPGEELGRLSQRMLRAQIEECFLVHDEHGRDVTGDYLTRRDGSVVFQREAMPSMLTRDINVIRQDCLGYLMQRFPHRAEHAREIGGPVGRSYS